MSLEDYLAGGRDRILASARPGQTVLDAPGIIGMLGSGPESVDHGRVVVTDDRAAPVLAEKLPILFARLVVVLHSATACHELMSTAAGYDEHACTAMTCADLSAVAPSDLPAGLELRCVRRLPHETGSVALEDAAAAAVRADPEGAPQQELDGFVAYLRSLPKAQLIAAVDRRGCVRATAGWSTFAGTAGVFFVSTDPGWRGRGVATAMTAAALRGAVDEGARRASLDASEAGVGIYLRLGFTAVGPMTQFVRAD